MGRLQAVENALASIDQATFQNLCDSFLALRNSNYSAFSRVGSQTGKQKTIKGTPDSFLLLPTGKYIFVEYSTNITAGLSKLQGDIQKCIDTSKTGIPVKQIAEIILCVNFNLAAVEIQTLKDLLANTRVGLIVYTLDSLAIELLLNHRNLAHEYLGLPLDTGQIISVEKFIAEYDSASKGISTPLDNAFLHREREIHELKESMHQNDFIILTGPPGIGKTKLALEGIKRFQSENLGYEAYCVSYKHHSLLEDLYQYFDLERDYLLFLDDANRIDAFSQITGFYRTTRKGRLKILITVRDYAFKEIAMLSHEFAPKRIDLTKFTDEQIVDIIKAQPFEILNQDYHREIIRIADGNPRLAIMTALLSKAKQDIWALHDVSDLFENYFSTFIKDEGEFAKALNSRCLGLIAFFYTIPYKNREITTSILNNFGIKYSEFIDAIDKLYKLELVEIQFEHVKIPEQNLATYFFYKSFIKDNLLSFKTLLDKYFDTNSGRFRDSVIPANNTFGVRNVMDKLQPYLKSHWNSIKSEEGKGYKFLETFWFYLKNETLEYVFNITAALPAVAITGYKVKYENNAFSYSKNDIIELLGQFFPYPNNLKDVLELGFEYVRKKPEHLPEWIHKIRERLTFDQEDQTHFAFARQIILFQILLTGLEKDDKLCTVVFYELSETFMSFKFHHTKGGRNHSFYMYYYSVPNVSIIQKFRQQIWNAVDQYFDKDRKDAFNFLLSYSSINPDVNAEIMKFDLSFLVKIIERHLSAASFEDCKYVQDQIRWCKRNSVSHESFVFLINKFTNPTYETFLKIDWDRLRDKEMYEFDDYKEYERLKEAEIRKNFLFGTASEVKKFYKIFERLKGITRNDWNYNATLDHVVDENCSKNFDIGCLLLLEIIKANNKVKYVPRIVFSNHLKSAEQSEKIWNIIQQHEFKHREIWELSFYDYLDGSLINKEYAQSLVNTFEGMKEVSTIHFDRLQRFLTIEPNLFQTILRAIVERNKKKGVRLQVWMDFFGNHFNQLGSDIALIEEAYLQQDKIHNHFDYEGIGFLNILRKDSSFLLKYVTNLYTIKKFGLSADRRNLGFVWKVEDIEEVLNEVFDLVTKKEPYFGILDHFCNTFFRNIQGETRIRAKEFLIDYCNTNFSDSDKMNVVVDIVRHSMSELFDEILLLFLSLTQKVETFSKIWWRGNGGSYTGNVIIGDIHAAEWRNILQIVEKSTVGAKLIPIKKYISDQVDYSLKSGDWERQRRFLERD